MWMSLVFAYDYFILYRIYLGEEGKVRKNYLEPNLPCKFLARSRNNKK